MNNNLVGGTLANPVSDPAFEEMIKAGVDWLKDHSKRMEEDEARWAALEKEFAALIEERRSLQSQLDNLDLLVQMTADRAEQCVREIGSNSEDRRLWRQFLEDYEKRRAPIAARLQKVLARKSRILREI